MVAGFYVKVDGPLPEREHYLEASLRRFLYTLQLVPEGNGKLLEIGAGPLLHHRSCWRRTVTTI